MHTQEIYIAADPQTLHIIATVATAAVMLFLSSVILIRERGSRVSVIFFLATLTISVWLFSFSNMYIATNTVMAFKWSKVAYLGIALIPAAAYHFTTIVLRIYDRHQRLVRMSWLISIGFAGYIIGTDEVFNQLYHYWWGYYPDFVSTQTSVLYLAFFFTALIFSLRAYWNAYQQAKSDVHKLRVRSLMIAFGIGYVACVDFLPSFGVPVYPFGYIPTLASFVLVFRTIHRYQLVDITPSYAAESIVKTMADPLIVCDEEWRIRVVNEAACAIFGYDEQEFLQQSVEQLICSGADAGEQLGVLHEHQPALDEEMLFCTKSGERITVSVSISHLRNRNGRIAGTVIIARDIRERKRTEERVQYQLERLTALRDIDIAIAASLDLRVTLNVVLDQVTNQLQMDAANALLFNPHAQTLEYVTERGLGTRLRPNGSVRLGRGLAGTVALERETISIPDVREVENGDVPTEFFERENFAAYYGVPLMAKGEVKGVLEVFHRKPRRPDPEWLDFLETLAGQAAIAIDNAQLFDRLQRSNVELKLAYNTTLEGWARALELRDMETEGHSRRVTRMTIRLARAMGMSDDKLVHVRRGALLHDIGKMGIPDNILLKAGFLNNDERAIIERHPVYAYELMLPIDHLRPALDIPYCHHEKWDGTGYPRGLAGNEIPLAARIFAVVDVYDALTSERPYREAWPEEEALEHIREQAGTHFDPEVVEAFVDMMEATA